MKLRFLLSLLLLPVLLTAATRTELRAYGKLTLEQRQSDGCTLSVFAAESPELARLTASKYLADLTHFGAAAKRPDGMVEVRHGGLWKLGLDGAEFYLVHAPDAAAMAKFVNKNKLDKLAPVPEKAYPRYLDNFDNAALCFWWKPFAKTPEEMAFFAQSGAQANHHNSLNVNYAPGIMDHSGLDCARKQLQSGNYSYRTMIFGGTDSCWYNLLNQPGMVEQNVTGFVSRDAFEGSGYYREQIASDDGLKLYGNTLRLSMELLKDDPNLLAWMEPHGELILFDERRPPNADAGFRQFLQNDKKYDLAALSSAWLGKNARFASWNDVVYPEPDWFAGRRGSYVDLDDIDWRWRFGTLEEGEKAGFHQPGFDDSRWLLSPRADERFSECDGSTVKDNRTGKVRTSALWARFSHDVPEAFLKRHQRVYLHVMPVSYRNKGLTVRVNGREIARRHIDAKQWIKNFHVAFDVTDALKAGKNDFIFCHDGGKIAYRVFLSPETDSVYPFASAELNRRFLDWQDYRIAEKNRQLEAFLSLIRTVDPVRPIKVMTPRDGFRNFELFERYGAYPQLTGEGSFFRPMHYKGYTALRNRTSSSEMGGPANNIADLQKIISYAVWENQNMHDYGFDLRELTYKKELSDWWLAQVPLLRTIGKVDYADRSFGLLRDMDQDCRYSSAEIWKWDISRGTAQELGLTPVLANGGDLIAGYARNVKVLWDCGTVVMSPELVQAVRDYIKAGGTFVATFNTGRHSPLERDRWALFAGFNLTVRDSVSGRIRFSDTQTLIPSMRGKISGGNGFAIDHTGNRFSGAIGIQGEAQAIANWEDGSMAIAEARYGKGRLIVLGAPLHIGLRDEDGKWLNEVDRNAVLREMLASLGIQAPTAISAGSRIWFDRRVSVNGLYDVYFAGNMVVDSRNPAWRTMKPQTTAELFLKRPAAPVIDVTTPGMPDVATQPTPAGLSLGQQAFHPLQIREFAVVRENVGLEAPRTWLKTQEAGWFKLKNPAPFDLEEARRFAEATARRAGEDGYDISQDWTASVNGGQALARKVPFGAWLTAGFPADTTRVEYRREVTIPEAWRGDGSRVFLRLMNPKYVRFASRMEMAIDGAAVPFRQRYELSPEMIKRGSFQLTIDAQDPTRKLGPHGMIFLHRLPKVEARMDLNRGWKRILSAAEPDGEEIALPYRGKLYGMSQLVEVPEAWRGGIVRLTMEDRNFFRYLIVNRRHIITLNHETPGVGVRLDGVLEPGKANRLELYGSQFRQSRPTEDHGTIDSATLEFSRFQK